MKEITKTLKAYLKEKRITQREIAEKLCTSQPYVAQLLNKGVFSRQQAEKWQELFGINAAWLLTGEGSMLVDSPVHHNNISIDASDSSVSVRGDGNTTLGSGAVMSPDASLLQAENEHLRDQLKTKDDQIAALQKIIEKLTS